MENERKYRNMPHHPMLIDFSIDTTSGNYSGVIAPKSGKVLFYGNKSWLVKDKVLSAILQTCISLKEDIENMEYAAMEANSLRD